VFGRLRRGTHRHDLETPEVAPRRDPWLEQRRIVGAHELETARVVEVDPTVDVVEPGRQLAPALAYPSVDLRRDSGVEVLDHHVEHAEPPPLSVSIRQHGGVTAAAWEPSSSG
jgi:hypothetical protein